MRQDKRAAPKAPINENISAREVRLIGADGEQIGIVSIDEALRIAEESKLDWWNSPTQSHLFAG